VYSCFSNRSLTQKEICTIFLKLKADKMHLRQEKEKYLSTDPSLSQLSSTATKASAPFTISLIWESIPRLHVSLPGDSGGARTETLP